MVVTDNRSTFHLIYAQCWNPCMCCTECLTFCCCTAITSLPEANGSLLCWFGLVLFQWFFFSGRMSALCGWPSLRMLDVILSTWSLHYLLSSTILPFRCSSTWNAWLACSLKPSRNCVLKRCRLFLLSPPASHVCSSQKKIPPLGWLLLSEREKTQNILQPFQLTSHSFLLDFYLIAVVGFGHCCNIHVHLKDTYLICWISYCQSFVKM